LYEKNQKTIYWKYLLNKLVRLPIPVAMGKSNRTAVYDYMKKRILIVEDDVEFGSLICEFLQSENFDTYYSDGGMELLQFIESFAPCLILIDRNLQGIDGLDIVKFIRKKGNEAPVIFITSLIDDAKVIEGLAMSDCEYLKKPFGLIELKMRIERCFQLKDAEKLFFSKKYYIPELLALKKDNQIINLSKSENSLLHLLFNNQEKVCSLELIISKVWGDSNLERINRVDVLINKLRVKLKGIPYIIENRKKVGYVLKKRD